MVHPINQVADHNGVEGTGTKKKMIGNIQGGGFSSGTGPVAPHFSDVQEFTSQTSPCGKKPHTHGWLNTGCNINRWIG